MTNDAAATPNAPINDLSFTVFGYVSRPVAEVYEAVADPEQLSKYFTTGGAHGRLDAGATVSWDFHDFPGAFDVRVIEAEAPRRIVIRWAGTETVGGDGTDVAFEFEPVDGGARTRVSVTESSWTPTAVGAESAFGNCMGWTGMLAAMKAWLEYGINLREGFYR